mmetsp:Transcript_59068/g.104998  ORF Transcript_59068/g.104998 Transcript_59068/m.104998 type:complete len:222 (-) Transcript_59068:86-751(-)
MPLMTCFAALLICSLAAAAASADCPGKEVPPGLELCSQIKDLGKCNQYYATLGNAYIACGVVGSQCLSVALCSKAPETRLVPDQALLDKGYRDANWPWGSAGFGSVDMCIKKKTYNCADLTVNLFTTGGVSTVELDQQNSNSEKCCWKQGRVIVVDDTVSYDGGPDKTEPWIIIKGGNFDEAAGDILKVQKRGAWGWCDEVQWPATNPCNGQRCKCSTLFK